MLSAARSPVDALAADLPVAAPPSETGGAETGGETEAGGAALETQRARRKQGLWALVVVQVCFGLFPVAGTLALRAFDPRVVTGWRITVGALVLGAAAFALHGRRALPTWRDLVWLQIAGSLGVSLNQLLFLEGLSRSTATNAGVLVCLIPVFTFAIATCVRQEPFSARRGFGLVLALFAALPLVLARGPGFSTGHALGNALMLGNALAYSGYLVMTRPLLARYPPLVVIAWAYLACLWQVPLLLGGRSFVPGPDVSPRAWGSLAFVLLGPTLLAYFLNTYALARVRATTTAAYIYAQPLISATAAAIVLGETLTARTLVAAAGIFLGLYLVLRAR